VQALRHRAGLGAAVGHSARGKAPARPRGHSGPRPHPEALPPPRQSGVATGTPPALVGTPPADPARRHTPPPAQGRSVAYGARGLRGWSATTEVCGRGAYNGSARNCGRSATRGRSARECRARRGSGAGARGGSAGEVPAAAGGVPPARRSAECGASRGEGAECLKAGSAGGAPGAAGKVPAGGGMPQTGAPRDAAGRSARGRGLWAECPQLRAECLPRAECRAAPSAAPGEARSACKRGSAGSARSWLRAECLPRAECTQLGCATTGRGATTGVRGRSATTFSPRAECLQLRAECYPEECRAGRGSGAECPRGVCGRSARSCGRSA
jgi:hypothetical protein